MITKVISEELVQKTRKIIDRHHRFVITAHISPDGDALGSSLGLYLFLRDMGKQATVILPDSVTDNLAWLPGAAEAVVYAADPAAAQAFIADAEVIFCVDFNEAKRMGPMGELVAKADAVRVMVDHHLYPQPFCDVCISHPEISSTSELIFRLICRMGCAEAITPEVATVVYTGMMTDTGAFTFNSCSPDIYIIISELLKTGINKDKIYDRVFNTFTADRERLMGYAVNRKMHIFEPYGAAMITLSREELAAYNFKKGDSEGFVNIPLAIKGIVFSAFFREEPEYIRVSLRSKGNFPANLIAERHFNGGGHKNAAGGEFYGTLAEAEALLASVLPEYFK